MRQLTAIIDISESTTISNAVEIGENNIVGIWVPDITTSTLMIHGAESQNGIYRPIQKDADSAVLTLPSGAGNVLWVISFPIPCKWIKIVAGTAQTTTDKTFYVLCKHT